MTGPTAPTGAQPADVATTLAEVADAVIAAHHQLAGAVERLRAIGGTDERAAGLLRTAADADESVVRLEAALVTTVAVERIGSASSPAAIGEALVDVATTWRARAEELLVLARLGQMEIGDALPDALIEFEAAGDHLWELVAALRTDGAEWSDELRDRAQVVVGDVRAAVMTLLEAVGS